jgi:aminoglycoside 6'-N-acetyltransferase I
MDATVTIRTLRPDDLALLIAVREGLFDNAVLPDQAQAFLDDPMHMICLAFAGDDAVGMATGTIVLHPDKPPQLFVNEVGVREAWQRRGIGRAVTEHLIAAARARGCVGAWLGTEPDNVAALALYRSMEGEEETFVGFGWDDAL